MNEQAIADAIFQGSAFSTFSSIDLVEKAVRWAIVDAMRLRGQTGSDDSMMQTITHKVSEVILRDYPSLTDKEFSLMLEAGISGELGRETWVSGASILQWMRSFMNHASRIAIIDKQAEAEEVRHRRTLEEIEEMNNLACREKAHSAYDYFKEHGVIFSGEDPRGFHLPQFASIVWQWIKTHTQVKEFAREQENAADAYADEQIAIHRTKKEYIPAAREDWRNSYFLEQYFNDIKNNRYD